MRPLPMRPLPMRPLLPMRLLRQARLQLQAYSTAASSSSSSRSPSPTKIPVHIVEVGPRDGLQNEKSGTISVEVKVELINRLARAGLRTIEAGSFVSPKWVPQMAGTSDVLRQIDQHPGVRYPVLIPNDRGLSDLLSLLSPPSPSPSPSPSSSSVPTEVSVFAAATDAFTRANTNVPTVSASLSLLKPVVRRAREHGLRVRGYLSVVLFCPYSGRVDPERVRDIVRALIDMGCYQVSLGDTVGMGTPESVREMLEVVGKDVPMDLLAGHFHDTYGTALANVLTALSLGVRTIDTSVAGLGGCPYSPGATGNVATEDVLYALRESPYMVEGDVDVEQVALVGEWISKRLGRENASRAGKAILGKLKKGAIDG